MILLIFVNIFGMSIFFILILCFIGESFIKKISQQNLLRWTGKVAFINIEIRIEGKINRKDPHGVKSVIGLISFLGKILSTYQFSSVAQSCPTLCHPMNRSMSGLPVHHQLPEFTQTHVH